MHVVRHTAGGWAGWDADGYCFGFHFLLFVDPNYRVVEDIYTVEHGVCRTFVQVGEVGVRVVQPHDERDVAFLVLRDHDVEHLIVDVDGHIANGLVQSLPSFVSVRLVVAQRQRYQRTIDEQNEQLSGNGYNKLTANILHEV